MSRNNSLGYHPIFYIIRPVFMMFSTIVVILSMAVIPEPRLFNDALYVCSGAFVAMLILCIYEIYECRHHISFYNGAKIALNSGFVPTYIGKNRKCDGIIMVDESQGIIYLNNYLYYFSEVKYIRSGAYKKYFHKPGYLEITMNSGSNPIKTVSLDRYDEARQLMARLSNSLGFL